MGKHILGAQAKIDHRKTQRVWMVDKNKKLLVSTTNQATVANQFGTGHWERCDHAHALLLALLGYNEVET